jgi:hypothetical protein
MRTVWTCREWRRTVDLSDCGHAGGVSLFLASAVKDADEVLNGTAPRSNYY